MKRLILLLLGIACCISCFASCNPSPQTPDSETESEVEIESEIETELKAETESQTQTTPTETQSQTEEQTTETEDQKAMNEVDFIVSVPADRQPVILQLTDTQIIDSSQRRTPDRIGATHVEYWGPDKKEDRCYGYLREIITNVKPDLILLTGDIVYGEFDDNGSALVEFVAFMESFGIPWAPVFGNHENESAMGVDWQCEQFVNAEHCLFVQRELSGNGNYTVGIEQGGKLTRVFFMLDSNGCSSASPASLENKNLRTAAGFTMKQTSWYKSVIKDIMEVSPNTKISFAFHIQPDVLGDIFAKYGTDGSTPVFIDYAENKQDGDFGYIGYPHETVWDANKKIWNSLKELGVDSIFLGHEHANSASIVYEGIRVQYGMKSSTYDSMNYIDESGKIENLAYSTNTPWVGGSVFNLDSEGNIVDPHIYYCENAGGKIDWDSIYANKSDPVCTRIEHDCVYSYVGDAYTPLYTPGSSATWNHVANIDDAAVDFLEVYGWVAFIGDSVGEFGYQIDDGEIVYSEAFTKTPEQGVIDAAAGRPAARYVIMVPIEGVTGEHTIRAFVRDANGNVEMLVAFTLIKTQ